MQGLVVCAPKLPTRSSFVLDSNHYKTFSSAQNQLLGSSISHPVNNSWRSSSSYHSLSGKLHGLLSYPALLKQFCLNSSTTLLSKTLVDCKVLFSSAQQRFNSGQRRGWNSCFQGLSGNDMVLGLVIANVAVFMLWRIADRNFMINNFMISLDNVKSGRLHTLITSAFSHVDMVHLVSNMIGLYFFGSSIAMKFGPDYLLKLYLDGAIGGSIFYLVTAFLLSYGGGPSQTPELGATGALYAIILLEIFLNPTIPSLLLLLFLNVKDLLWLIIKGSSSNILRTGVGGAPIAALAWFRLFMKGRF